MASAMPANQSISFESHADMVELSSMPWEFDQTYFPFGDGHLLRLREKPNVVLDSAQWRLRVTDWDISLAVDKAADIPAEICRQFLFLWHRAESGQLSDSEAKTWQKIAEVVDYGRFCEDRAAPRYFEAILNDRNGLVVRHDGEILRIPHNLLNRVSFLRPGDLFSAFAKFDSAGGITALDRVVPLKNTGMSGSDDRSWPPVLS